jgi:hypothetical protein
MADVTPDMERALYTAQNRLHHLSFRYVGAMVEVVGGKPVTVLPKCHPGVKECRDLIDLILFTRAEINALTKVLITKGVFTEKEYVMQATEEYSWFCKEKASWLGVEVTDVGLSFDLSKFKGLSGN